MNMNAKRAAWAKAAIIHHRKVRGDGNAEGDVAEDVESGSWSVFTDLLTDMRHLADTLRLDFHECVELSERNYMGECETEADNEE